MRNVSICAAIAAALAGTASAGSCIISGYPLENPKSALASTPAAVETGTLATPSSAFGLEARYRTWLEALLGTRFNSFKPIGTFFILR